MKILVAIFITLSCFLSAQVTITPGKNGGTSWANTGKTLKFGDTLRTIGTYTHSLIFRNASKSHTFPDTSDQVALFHYTIPISGTLVNYPITGPLDFSYSGVGTQQLLGHVETGSWTNSKFFNIGLANSSNFETASKQSKLRISGTSASLIFASGSGTTTNVRLSSGVSSIFTYDGVQYTGNISATNNVIGLSVSDGINGYTHNFTIDTSNIQATNDNPHFTGFGYDSASSVLVSANGSDYNIFHRKYNDGRYLQATNFTVSDYYGKESADFTNRLLTDDVEDKALDWENHKIYKQNTLGGILVAQWGNGYWEYTSDWSGTYLGNPRAIADIGTNDSRYAPISYTTAITHSSAPLSISSGTISISQANGSTNGYLTSTDWTTFNNKQSTLSGTGFVYQSGSTTSYTPSIPNSALANSTFTVNGTGMALGTSSTITAAPSGSAGGDLTGSYPNPTLAIDRMRALIPTGVKTASYTASANDFIPYDLTSGSYSVTLPNAPADKSVIGVKIVTQPGTNSVTIVCSGSDVFNKTGGSTSGTITLLGQDMIFQYKASGAIWYVLADDISLAQMDARYSPIAGSSSITTVGTTTAGTWNASLISGQYGGTGVANTGKTLTLSASSSGSFNQDLQTGSSVTFSSQTLTAGDGNDYLKFTSGGNARLNMGTLASGAHVYIRSQNSVNLRLGVNSTDYISINSSGRTFFGGTTTATAIIHLAAGTASASTAPLKFTSGTNLTTTEAGAVEYNGSHLYFTASNGGTRYQLDQQGTSNYMHSISTPTVASTVNLVNNSYNIINPSGTLASLTVNLPSSPANNDVVFIKFTQAITALTYGNGTVADQITAPTLGQLVVLVYDSGTSTWY